LGASGVTAAYRGLGPWFRLVEHFPERLTAASTSPAISGLFVRCGVSAVAIPPWMPALEVVSDDEHSDIEVVILAGVATVASTAHMVGAVAHARRSGLGIRRLWIPASDEQAVQIARSFAAGLQIERYDDLEGVFSEPRRLV